MTALDNLDGFLDQMLKGKSSAITKDLRLNLGRLLRDGALEPADRALTLLATATSVGSHELETFARSWLRELDITEEQVNEAAESAAMMGMLNMYYRFKHMVTEGQEQAFVDQYRSAGLRMNALAKPVLGKERFEMLALAVSVLGGCQTCISSHEKVLRDAGVEIAKIQDLARIAAVVRGVATLARIPA
jgi:alkyl hydroperoxide reductase subunit D